MCAVSDYSAYDGSQRTIHGRIERIYTERIVGEELAKVWKYVAGQALRIDAGSFVFEAPY